MPNKYNVWLADANCNPIEGTDKYYWGRSARWVMQHVAAENGIKIKQGALIVRLPNGNAYYCQKAYDVTF